MPTLDHSTSYRSVGLAAMAAPAVLAAPEAEEQMEAAAVRALVAATMAALARVEWAAPADQVVLRESEAKAVTVVMVVTPHTSLSFIHPSLKFP
jgi:D-alanine-D-alanine ligase-like ATP-grasp enzyme